MTDNPHHEHLIKEMAENMEPVLSNSPQAIYIYIDDEHKICNKKFADMLGYSSVQEWVDNQTPISDIVEEDREKVIKAYMSASEDFKASILKATVVKKNEEKIQTEIIMAPITYKGEVFVLHFISEIK